MPLILVRLAAVVVVKFAWLLAALLVTVAIAATLGKQLARRDDRAVARRRADAEICARADRQHAAVLAGDDRGVYGNYPPGVSTVAVLPQLNSRPAVSVASNHGA